MLVVCSRMHVWGLLPQIPEGEKGTTIHAAAAKGWYKIVEVLLANGADAVAGWKGLVQSPTFFSSPE